MEQEIKEEFERSGFSLDEEEEILKKCLTFCINYKLTASDLVSSWEVYYLNRLLQGSDVQNAYMDGFLLHLQNEQKEAIMKEEAYPHMYSINDVNMLLSDEHEETKETVMGTPSERQERLDSEPFDFTPGTDSIIPSSGKPSRISSNHITPFAQRTKKFVVQFTLNKISETENGMGEPEDADDEDDIIKRVQPSERCSLEIQQSRPESGCRFMYDRIEDKFNSLENRIRRHAAAFVASGLFEEPMDPTMASQKSVFSVGMVCCDGEGRLNEKSTLLQGSVEHSGGQRVRLDLQKLQQFSFFPGQVVGIEGHNPSGHCLIASKVVDSIPLSVSPDVEIPPPKRQAMDQEFQPDYPSSKPEMLNMVIAAGPFTTTDNLLFEPLIELLAYATRKQPQLLLLMGPFVDSEHPEIKTGTVDKSFTDILHAEILTRLQDYLEYMGTAARVILVPSIRDACHDFVFPQPAFDIRTVDLKNQISCLTNPGIFDANKVKVGCCTIDILKQLSGEEISRIPADLSSRDRMGRLATHLLNQRSFYPLYPPSEDVPLDLSLAPEALKIPSIPNILILPSDLSPFVKVLSLGEKSSGQDQSRCIAVNPGRLSKGIGGGTFVELNYQKDSDKTNASIVRM
ncbi:hypothetical protein AQUCO_01100282v1 [Aquilegia coerulea]|uniref:DNA polymerase alpha subunit B n=1 Tax=Aquilegia coerulea TaxID=218851 RepID=A0A2G5E6G2_AQUCA|nr:hypothetical protein AQUCO_01100282v1 [Aquilegia coerulea]